MRADGAAHRCSRSSDSSRFSQSTSSGSGAEKTLTPPTVGADRIQCCSDAAAYLPARKFFSACDMKKVLDQRQPSACFSLWLSSDNCEEHPKNGGVERCW